VGVFFLNTVYIVADYHSILSAFLNCLHWPQDTSIYNYFPWPTYHLFTVQIYLQSFYRIKYDVDESFHQQFSLTVCLNAARTHHSLTHCVLHSSTHTKVSDV